MKKLLILVFALVMILSLTGCGLIETPDLSDPTKAPDTSDPTSAPDTLPSEPSDTNTSEENAEPEAEWYDNGCYIEYTMTMHVSEQEGGDGKTISRTGKIYFDGEKLLAKNDYVTYYARELTDEYYENTEDGTVCTIKKNYVTASMTDIEGPREYSYPTGEYFFDRTNIGAHINDGGQLDSCYRLSRYTKTDEKETVCGRVCTIYEHNLGKTYSGAEWISRKCVDDEYGIILKTYDTGINTNDNNVHFEVTQFEAKKTEVPAVDFLKQ